MSSIYDIAGTTSDSFSLNGKCTLLQGSDIPSNYQGMDGDIYFRDNGYLYTKSGGQWNQVNATSLPSAKESENKFLYSNGETYQASERSIDEIVYVDELQNSVSDLQKELQNNVNDLQGELQNSVSDLQKELQNVDNSTLHKTGDNEVTLTRGNYNTRVVQQDDGNFVIYKDGQAVISTQGGILQAPNNQQATTNNSVLTCTGINKSGHGFIKMGNGIIIQWGQSGTGVDITLPTPFASTNYKVVSTGSGYNKYGPGYSYNYTTTTFRLGGDNGNRPWIAIGY